VKIGVTLPAGVASPDAKPMMNWGYDPTTGKWNKPTTITQTGPEYFLPCTTLYQNMDAFIQTGTLSGTVNCSGGKPAAFVPITIQSPYDKYQVVTNENGKFRAQVEATGSWNYTVTAEGGNNVTVNSVPANGNATASGLTTQECDNAPPPPPPAGGTGAGSGKFAYSGGSFTGICVAVSDVVGCPNGIDVAIATASGTGFAFYNMPQGSSGNFTLGDGYNATNSCDFFALFTLNTGTQYASKSGTVTKTGAKSFTFTCTVYDLNTNASFSVTGSGNY
jgi:hypothetical protein